MNCPKCGNKNLEVRVSMRFKILPDMINNITKKSLSRKGVKILWADWEGGKMWCSGCKWKEEGL